MIPVRLEIKNFLAYRSPDPLRFDGIHLACLTGANGAGKSSLLDAMTWALWGKARAKRDAEMVHTGQSDMHVQLDFEQEGQHYRVIRRLSKKKQSTSTLDLFSVLDGQLNTLSEPSMRETQHKINRLLRLDYETFVHSAFLQQGRADAFTTKAPAQRKQILGDILGLAQWEHYEEAAKEMLNAITDELRVIDGRIRDIEQELSKEPRLKTMLAEAEAAQQEAEAALNVADAKLAEVAHAPASLRAAQERKAEQERHKRERQRDLDAIQSDIERQEARITDYEAIIAGQAEIEAGYAALQTAREADSALGEKLLQLSDFDAERHALDKRLRDAQAELENEASAYSAQISELERAVQAGDPDALNEVQAAVMMLEGVKAERDAFQNQIMALGEERAALEARRTTLADEGKDLRDRIERLRATDAPICPVCGQELDEAHRSQLIEQLEAEIVEKRGHYSANQERLKAIGDEQSAGREQLAAFDVELKRLSPLLERAGTLQAQINAAEDAQLRLDAAVAQLDALNAMLSEGSFAQDIRQQIAALDERRAAIGYDRSTHDAARQQLDAYREFEVRQKQLAIAQAALPDAQAALEGARLRLERTEKALVDDQAALAALAAEIAELEVLVKEQQVRQQEVNRLRTFERQQYERVVSARQELEALEQGRKRKAELEARRVTRRHDEALYKQLRDAFGKNGVPAMIIEAAIPELEESANRLLARMTDGRMHLNFSTQREKVSSEGVIETLDIQIADELGTRSYEMYSGGEAFRINFAVRVALSQLLARRAGAHLRTLFIDEGFGTQDEDGRNKLVEAITAIQDDFDLILVITHIDDLRDSFPVHVIVQKTPNGSRVSVR
ncbi:MAG: SMC family ATPase [Anaerolineae bacterium]|nr:SMC family ATPase [Anaerolineae bacterium]